MMLTPQRTSEDANPQTTFRITKFHHKLNILSFYSIYIYCRNLISCKAALQRLYRKKRYTNKLELNWTSPSVVLSVKRWISKSYNHCWKGFKYTKMLENQRICGSWRIFLKNSSSLTDQNKQETHEQLSLNKQTQLWIIQLTTQY